MGATYGATKVNASSTITVSEALQWLIKPPSPLRQGAELLAKIDVMAAP